MRVELRDDLSALLACAGEWDGLACRAQSPFLTSAWLTSWWRAFGERGFLLLLLRDDGGVLRGGACFRRPPAARWAGFSSASNVHSGDWDVVAADAEAARQVWEAIGEVGGDRLQLTGLRDTPEGVGLAREVLLAGGFRVLERDRTASPWLRLPASYEELLAARSRNLRSQLNRRRRALEREGALVVRVSTSVADVERDLPELFRVESSGWKAAAGTAISSDEKSIRLYRDFALHAAAQGWLRLYLLESNGSVIAGDLGCVFAGGSWLIKTGFDERLAHLSPGLVLRAAALQAAIGEGCSYYEFLGGPDSYKLRWTSEYRPRVAITAYRGAWRAAHLYRTRVRPLLAKVRHRGRPPKDQADLVDQSAARSA